jgi:cell division protein FtsB
VDRLKVASLLAVVTLAAYFAVFGGEYSVPERRALEGRVATLNAEIGALRAEVDSLQGFARRLERDPATLERVARERYGMIRDGEVLYRFVEPPRLDAPSRAR